MCVLYKFYVHNKIEIVCMVVLVVGSESSQNWVRVVSGLGPIRLGSEKYQGSELSWVRVVRLPTISSPCEPDGSGELKMEHGCVHTKFITTELGHILKLRHCPFII